MNLYLPSDKLSNISRALITINFIRAKTFVLAGKTSINE